MSYSLNALKGDYIGGSKGDTRSLDYAHTKFKWLACKVVGWSRLWP